MRKLIDFQKPYISAVDLKPKFEPAISLVGTTLDYDELFDLKRQIDEMINEIRLINDYFNYHDELSVKRFVEEYK